MKKRLVLIGVLAVAIVVFAVAVLVSRKSGSSGGVCVDLINHIRKNDAKASYALFTPDAQTLSTADQWKTQVKGLYSAYYDPAKPEPKLKKETTNTTVENTADESEKTQIYVVSSGDSRYLVTCNLKQTDTGLLIDGFSSKASDDPADYRKITGDGQDE